MTEDTTPPEGLTARDEAELAYLSAPEVQQITISNYLPVSVWDGAPDQIGLVLAMADRAFHTLVDEHGGDPLDLSFAMSAGFSKAHEDATDETVPTIELGFATTRPMDFVYPEGASFGEGAVSDGE